MKLVNNSEVAKALGDEDRSSVDYQELRALILHILSLNTITIRDTKLTSILGSESPLSTEKHIESFYTPLERASSGSLYSFQPRYLDLSITGVYGGRDGRRTIQTPLSLSVGSLIPDSEDARSILRVTHAQRQTGYPKSMVRRHRSAT